VDLSRTVGWFTTLFPVLLHLEAGAGPGEALKSIKEQLRRLPNHGIGYGLLRYLSGDPGSRRQLRALRQAEVSFNYLGQFDHVLSRPFMLGGTLASSGPLRSPRQRRSHLIEINGLVTGDRLELSWTYSEAIHRRTTIEALAQRFVLALRRLVAHCQAAEDSGFTASDFPLAQLDQQQLDRLIKKVTRRA
jgi:non-ribosomal peptide synthase protein (TIGR01720 family)